MFPKHPICACHRLACPPAQRPLARLGARPPACPRACLPTRPPTHLSSCPPACPLFRPPVRLSAYCNRESADAVTKNGFEQQTQTPIPKFKTSEKAFRCLRKKRPRLSRNGKSSSAPAPPSSMLDSACDAWPRTGGRFFSQRLNDPCGAMPTLSWGVRGVHISAHELAAGVFFANTGSKKRSQGYALKRFPPTCMRDCAPGREEKGRGAGTAEGRGRARGVAMRRWGGVRRGIGAPGARAS